ncbi:MAG: multidrug efflux pump [Mariniblastus sp.]|jgi:multidrug efflux pump
MNLADFFYRNTRLMLLAVSLILVSGLSSFFILPRMEDPQLVERGAFVNTVFPGAEPSRVEALVSEKIEDALNEIEEIKEIRSVSRESISTISLELRDEVDDADRVWTRIRDRLDDVTADLPPGALKPDFDVMDFKAYALLTALKWERPGPVNYAVLHRWAKQLEDRIQSVSGTEKAEMFGEPSEEILVTLNANQLNALNLTVADVARQIGASDSKLSAGQLRSGPEDMLIQVAGELDSIQRIENIPIRYQGDSGFVRLSNLAEVKKTIADPPDSLAIIDGKRAVVVGGFVRPNNRIDIWSRDVTAALAKFETELPAGIALDLMFDQNAYVSTRLSTLLMNLLMGASAVFVVIFVLMGWRSALVVSISLPLATLMVMFGMRILDVPIHQMSVTGLIIALGLLIDNAIVIVEEMSIKMRNGATPAQAVTQSVNHLFFPLLGSTLTTALAFGPIALMPGPAGEFIGSIAINVIIAIFSSFFLAMTIIPAISARISELEQWFTKHRTAEHQANSRPRFWRSGYSNQHLTRIYKRSLDVVFRRPVIGVGLGIVLPILGFISAFSLSEQFFPPSDRDQLQIELELSPQSSLASTLSTSMQIREVLLEQLNVKRVDWFVGESAPAFYYNLIPRRAAVSQYAQAMIQLTTTENQAATIHRLQALLDQRFPHARVLVRQLEQGPPFDAPVEVRLFGPDLQTLQKLGGKLRTVLVNTPGVIHTRVETEEVLPKILLDVNEENARAAGLNLTEIAMQLNAATEGTIGGSIIEATEELPVRVRLSNGNRGDINSLASLDIISQSPAADANDPAAGNRYRGVPITAIAEIGLESEPGSITHLAGRRLNELQAFIPAGVLPSTVLKAFQSRLKTKLDSGEIEIPPGYSLDYGGEAAKRDEAVSNLMASVGILMVLMIATLVLSFGSFRIAGIVGATGGLSIGLGMGALWIFGYPFGFTAIVGAMGLMGVAINDSIVVLAAIRGNEAAARGDRHAMREVVNQSTRHIISTSLTTMAGFTPLIMGGGGFWPPLAVAIAGGVGGATILALYLAPSAYLMLMCKPQPNSISTPYLASQTAVSEVIPRPAFEVAGTNGK